MSSRSVRWITNPRAFTIHQMRDDVVAASNRSAGRSLH
jgi:hypothetical protein